jgi:hypothetical protein
VKKKSWTLVMLQASFPVLSGVLVGQSIAVAWTTSPDPASRWIQMLPIVGGVVGALGAAAGIGPLAADKIKQQAGVLGKEEN